MKKVNASKQAKLVIQKVTIKHSVDENPDTSWIGEYSDRPSSEFSIDCATDLFQGDIDAGREWLDRIIAAIRFPVCWNPSNVDEIQANEDFSRDWISFDEADKTLRELRDSEPFDNVSWDSRTYRYFNPGTVESFKLDAEWIPANLKTKEEREAYWQKSMRENALADYKRMESLNNGDYCFMGISATAEVWNPKTQVVRRIHSGGLWGIESDSEKSYLESVEQEELGQLKTQLTALGFSKRAITKAFQSIVRKES